MKATKKIVGAACALVAAVALSAGSTFAWFTSNNTVDVTQIEATVVTGGGDLRIAQVTGTTIGAYSYHLTAPTFSGKLDAVTTTDALKFNKLTSKGTDGTVTADTAATAGTEFYQFTIALISSTDMKVYLDAGTAVGGEKAATTPDSAVVMGWASDTTSYGKEMTLNGKLETEAKYASRVSFVQWKNGEDGKTLKAPEAAADVKATKYFAPYDYSDQTLPIGVTEAGYYKGNIAKDYMKGVTTGVYPTTDKAAAYYLPTGADTVDILATANTVASEGAFVELTANVPAVVTISLWIEGEDGDCFNNIFADKVTLDLKFFGVTPTTTPTE